MRKFVLTNIPHSYNARLIKDYIEGTLDVDVVDVKVHPFIPGKALVILKDDLTDFQIASEAVKNERLEGREITIVNTQQEMAIVILNIDCEVLQKDILISYFKEKFANVEAAIKSCKICPDLNIAVVHFHEKYHQVLKDILKMKVHTPLPSKFCHITIEPFYTNFHDFIPTLISEDDESSSDAEIGSEESHSHSDSDSNKSSENVSDVEEKSESENSENESTQPVSKKYDYDTDDAENEEKANTAEESDSSGSESVIFMGKQRNAHSGFRGRGRGSFQRLDHLSREKDKMEYENIDVEKCFREKNAYIGRGAFAMRGRGSKHNNAEKSFNNQGKSSGGRQSHKHISLPKSSTSSFQGCTDKKRNQSQSDSSNDEDNSKRLSKRNSSPRVSFDLSTSAKESEPTNQKASRLHRWRSESSVDNNDSQKNASKKFIWNSSNTSNENISSRKASPLEDKQCVSQPMKKLKSVPIFSGNVASNDSDGKPDISPLQGSRLQKKTRLSEHYKESIDKLEEELKYLSEENARLKDKPKQSEIKLDMTSLQAKLLQPFFNTHQVECQIRYAVKEKAAVITGPDNLVKEFQLNLMLELRKIKEDYVAISKEMLTILTKEKGKKFLLNLGLNGALTAVENDSVKVAAFDENVLLEALKVLKSKLDGKETCTSDVEIPSEKFDHLKLRLEHDLLICVILEEKDITLVGVKDDVDIALRDVNNLLEDIGHYEKSFEVGEPEAKFFYCCLEEKIYSALKLVEITEQLMSETKLLLKFKGQKKNVHEAYQCLREIKDNVRISKWNLKDYFKEHELLLIAKNYDSDRTRLETFDYKEKYLYTFHISEEVDVSSLNQGNITLLDTFFNYQSPELTFDLSSTCKLIIKSEGNITKERSDVLVSLLGPEHDMRKTAVGKAFNSACPSHYKCLNECIDSDPTAKVFTVDKCGKLKCLAICHIVLNKWDSNNPDQSESLLTEAFKSVFSSAKTLGAKSVSFPAVGCGRAFKFPPSKVAEIFLQSLKDEKVETFLEKVAFLASEKDLFEKLKTSAPSIFQVKADSSDERETASEPDAESDYEEDSEGEDIVYPIDRKNLKNVQMTIFTLSKDIVESLKNEKKKSIIEQFLHVDHFQQNLLKRWPKSSWGKIVKEAVQHNVWVEQQQNKTTKDIDFCLTGQREKVLQVKSFINQEFLDVTKYLPKKQLISSQAPKRGTLEFMKFAIESDERFPSYWSINSNKKCLRKLREGRIIEPGEFDLLVSVDPATKDAVSKLFLQTMDPTRIGHGADAQGIAYTKLDVIDVQRVENPELFDTYRRERERLFRKMVQIGCVCKNIGTIGGSNTDVATAPLLNDSLKKELYHEINEHYLFHGAKADTITTLINSGLDPRVSNESCMFGKGIYTAEKSTKADQYADIRGQRVPNGTPLKMILTRLLLGNVFVCDSSHKSVRSKDSIKLSRPPCMKCQEDKCLCPDQILYDSVLGDGKWLFREFVVYHSNCCYPEFVITYRRL
ncbi:hypothetical protein Btru_066222 [Bulinus truncatus]|nr:hypothetical protein Btru_066222 [Bulinus truncatus]